MEILKNYINFRPVDEFNLAKEKTESLFCEKPFMGRFFCLILVPVHAVNIVIKPIIYVALTITYAIATVISGIGLLLSITSVFRYHRKEVLIKNFTETFNLGLCVIVSPIGQFAQLLKSICGVFYQKIYFKISTKLILQRYCEYIATIGAKLKHGDAELEEIRRLTDAFYERHNHPSQLIYFYDAMTMIVKYIEKHPESSVIPSIIGNLGNFNSSCLEGMIARINNAVALTKLPENINGCLSFILNEYKHACIVGAANTIVDIHYVNAITLSIGEKIGLSKDKIEEAKKDSYVSAYDFGSAKRLFKAECSEEGFIDYVLMIIEKQAIETKIKMLLVEKKIEQLENNPAELTAFKTEFRIDDKEWDYNAEALVFTHCYCKNPNDKNCDRLNRQAIKDLALFSEGENPFEFIKNPFKD